MGLDQYAYALDVKPETPVDFAMPELSDEAWNAIFDAIRKGQRNEVRERKRRRRRKGDARLLPSSA